MSKRRVKLPGRYMDEEKWYIVQFIQDEVISYPIPGSKLEDHNTGETGYDKLFKLDDTCHAPWKDGKSYEAKIIFESETKEDCQKYRKTKSANSDGRQNKNPSDGPPKKKKAKKDTAEEEDGKNDLSKKNSSDGPPKKKKAKKDTADLEEEDVIKNDLSKKKKENAQMKKDAERAKKETEIKNAENLFRHNMHDVEVSEPSSSKKVISNSDESNTPHDALHPALSNTGEALSSHNNNGASNTSQTDNDAPILTKTSGTFSPQTNTSASNTSNANHDPPRTVLTNTSGAISPHTNTGASNTSQANRDSSRPAVANTSGAISPHTNTGASNTSQAYRDSSRPVLTNASGTFSPHTNTGASNTSQANLDSSRPVLTNASGEFSPHTYTSASNTSHPNHDPPRLVPNNASGSFSPNNGQPYHTSSRSSVTTKQTSLQCLDSANADFHSPNNIPSSDNTFTSPLCSFTALLNDSQDDDSFSNSPSVQPLPALNPSNHNQNDGTSAYIDSIQKDLDYWRSEASRLRTELDQCKAQLNILNKEQGKEKDMEDNHYKPKRGVQFSKCKYIFSGNGLDIPADYVHLIDGHNIYVPVRWLNDLQGMFKGKTKPMAFKLMISSMYEPSEVLKETALLILQTPLGQALKSYAMNILGMPAKSVTDAINSKIGTMTRAIKLGRVPSHSK